jgi:hypothetical protein
MRWSDQRSARREAGRVFATLDPRNQPTETA